MYTPKLERLEELVNLGYLKKQVHPTLPLTIWNYTHVAQFENNWNEDTLHCRGLVTDDQGKVWARPFPKFFNIEEHQYKVPNEPFDVFEKVDGSLGILFKYEDQLVFCSRGSFESEQAKEFQKIWIEKGHTEADIHPGYTYLFEIIYPENRIVIDYGTERKIVYLTQIQTSTGFEPKFYTTPIMFEAAKTYHFDSIDQVMNSNLDNSEGYVVRFESGFRVKIKFAEYVRLHKLITQASSLSIWESLSNGDDLEKLLAQVPDEFYAWVKQVKADLEKQFEAIDSEAKKWFSKLMAQKFHNRKDNANFVVNSTPKKLHAILFKMLDEKPYAEIIWKQIRPQYEKPFWNKTEDPS
jgi:RNA ligase